MQRLIILVSRALRRYPSLSQMLPLMLPAQTPSLWNKITRNANAGICWYTVGWEKVLYPYSVHECLVGEDTSMKTRISILTLRKRGAFNNRSRVMEGIGVCRLSVKYGLGFGDGLRRGRTANWWIWSREAWINIQQPCIRLKTDHGWFTGICWWKSRRRKVSPAMEGDPSNRSSNAVFTPKHHLSQMMTMHTRLYIDLHIHVVSPGDGLDFEMISPFPVFRGSSKVCFPYIWFLRYSGLWFVGRNRGMWWCSWPPGISSS